MRQWIHQNLLSRCRRSLPHAKNWAETSSEHMRAYLAGVHSLDEEIGRLLNRLDELGLRENTIVVFSSDQASAPSPPPMAKSREAEMREALTLPTQCDGLQRHLSRWRARNV